MTLLTEGFLMDCDDENVSGGIKNAYLANCSEWDKSPFTLNGEDYEDGRVALAPEVFYQYLGQKFKTLVNGTFEGAGIGGKYLYEFQMFLPGDSSEALAAGRKIQQAGKLILITEDYQGVLRLYGFDEVLAFQASGWITADEDATGADLSEADVKGSLITLSFQTGEKARLYIGDIADLLVAAPA